MQNKLLILVVSALLIASGCGGSVSAPTKESPAATPEAPAIELPAEQPVKLESDGGVVIVGSYFPPVKKDSPGVVLLHQWYSDRGSFGDFARKLQANGFAALSIDGRGFGESTKTIDGTAVPVSNSVDTVNSMLVDVENAVAFLAKQDGVDGGRIGIVGASYGSSQAIMYAADHNDVKAVALLSPGLNYFGTMATGPAAARFGDRPLFAVASDGDEESATAVKSFKELKGDVKADFFKLYPGKAHGTNLFKNDSGAEQDLLEFLKKNL